MVEGKLIDVDVEERDRVAPEVEQHVVADLHRVVDDPGEVEQVRLAGVGLAVRSHIDAVRGRRRSRDRVVAGVITMSSRQNWFKSKGLELAE